MVGHRFGRFRRKLYLWMTAACELALTWISRSKERRALAALDQYALKDIGISAADVEAEYRKPFWCP